MLAKIYITGVIGEDVSLLDVMRQYKSFSNPTSVEVIIDSVGGSVDVGQSIFSYLRNLQIPVKTYAKRAYSIASVIFMAGDEREVEQGQERLMIHFPFVQNASGGSKELEDLTKQLKALESDFIKFYGIYTGIDADTIKTLLENETFLSGDDAFDLGFATTVSIPLAAVAYYTPEEINDTKTNKNVIMKNAEKLIKALQVFVSPKEVPTEIVALVLQDANGIEITFPAVADDAMPEVGDTATVDGAPAEGEYVAPDGSTFVFSGGELTEVKPAEEPAPETEEEAAARIAKEEEDARLALENENSEITKLLETLFNKATSEVEEKFNTALTALAEENKKVNDELKAMRVLLGSAEVKIEAQEKENRGTAGRSKALAILNKRK